MLLLLFLLSIFCTFLFFFFNDTATTEIYTLSLHDALPIFRSPTVREGNFRNWPSLTLGLLTRSFSCLFQLTSSTRRTLDRKSTRLNSSHVEISYAVFCLKKKKKKK